MEKDLGFGNGYLNPKKVNDIKMGRLFAILDYLGVSRAEFFCEDTAEAETEKMIRQWWKRFLSHRKKLQKRHK